MFVEIVVEIVVWDSSVRLELLFCVGLHVWAPTSVGVLTCLLQVLSCLLCSMLPWSWHRVQGRSTRDLPLISVGSPCMPCLPRIARIVITASLPAPAMPHYLPARDPASHHSAPYVPRAGRGDTVTQIHTQGPGPGLLPLAGLSHERPPTSGWGDVAKPSHPK